jgi:hypothetical protein
MTEYVTQKQYDTSEHLAKKLNNRASVLIMMADNNSSNNDGTNTNTNTNYDKAIVLLSKALKEMEKNMLHHDVEICTCECTCNNLFGESTESEIQSESDHHHHQKKKTIITIIIAITIIIIITIIIMMVLFIVDPFLYLKVVLKRNIIWETT